LAGPVVFSTKDGLSIADDDWKLTPVASSPPNLERLFGDPLGGGGLFALDPASHNLLYFSNLPSVDFTTTVLFEEVDSFSASAKYLLVNNTVYTRETREGKPTAVAYSPPDGVILTDVDDDYAFAYDSEAQKCDVISLANPGDPEVLADVASVWKGLSVAVVFGQDGDLALFVWGRRFPLPDLPDAVAASKTAYALWDGSEPTIVRPAAPGAPRVLSFQFAGGTAFLFEPGASVFGVSWHLDSVALRRCFGSTAVLIGETVIAAEFGKVVLYPRGARAVERDSVLARATAFVPDPLANAEFFAYFADAKEVVVANKDLAVLPYLPNVEAFDVSKGYFASIETGDALFVRRRDGGDSEPVIAGRPVPPGARVFVDDAAVYVLDAAGATRIAFDGGTESTLEHVTAVWSTDKVVVEVDGKRLLIDGEIELDLDLRADQHALAVALDGTEVIAWTSVAEPPTRPRPIPVAPPREDSELLTFFGSALPAPAAAAFRELIEVIEGRRDAEEIVDEIATLGTLAGYPERLVGALDRLGILLVSIAVDHDLSGALQLQLLTLVSPTPENAEALAEYFERIDSPTDDDDESGPRRWREFRDLAK
jgi:hypothetical protein